jgi:predicted lipoprotein with Yx(FWY)xxD motif
MPPLPVNWETSVRKKETDMKPITDIKLLTGLAFAALLMATSPVLAEDYGPFKPMQTSLGKVLVNANGMTLYTYDEDASGKSNCNGECAEYWPPAAATASDKPVGDLTIIKRDDGSMQWADDGKPLYTFKSDMKPGDTLGDKKKDVWHVVKE